MKKIYLAIFLSLAPFLWLFTQFDLIGNWAGVVANILGLCAVVLFVWQMALGLRQVSARLSVDYVGHIKLHSFLGIYGTIFVLLHPLLILASYQTGWQFLFTSNFTPEFDRAVFFGRLALLLFLVIWITSALLKSRLPYRLWGYLHYLSYFMVFLSLLHASEIGSFLNAFPWLMAYWTVLILSFWLMVFTKLAHFFSLGKSRYRLIRKQVHPGRITRYFFSPLSRPLLPRPGQFVYLKPGRFAESHPFTVMRSDPTTGNLEFGIKAVGKFTNQLESLSLGSQVFVDGPYGIFTAAGQNHHPKVIFAGGIGITPFVELISRFSGPQTYLFYSNKSLDSALERDNFRRQLGANYREVVTAGPAKPPVISGRLDSQTISRHLTDRILSTANFFICGPAPFMSGLRRSLLDLGVAPGRIFMEEFSL